MKTWQKIVRAHNKLRTEILCILVAIGRSYFTARQRSDLVLLCTSTENLTIL